MDKDLVELLGFNLISVAAQAKDADGNEVDAYDALGRASMTTWKSELGTLNIVFDEDNDTLSVLRIRLASGRAVAAEAA